MRTLAVTVDLENIKQILEISDESLKLRVKAYEARQLALLFSDQETKTRLRCFADELDARATALWTPESLASSLPGESHYTSVAHDNPGMPVRERQDVQDNFLV